MCTVAPGRRAVDCDELILLLHIAPAACRQWFLQYKGNFVPALLGLPSRKVTEWLMHWV